ncbi:hypothetical protein DHX103_05115 [Planococcus sp. X10-3]|uniref:hypothetical protein n=1 Tax=Planococcus sp. X10-3 TaxID=3061240 RepID=UPI003BB1E748
MKNKSYFRESIEVYLFVFLLAFIFLGGIIATGEISGQDWIGILPEFSWDMINTWNEIRENNS